MGDKKVFLPLLVVLLTIYGVEAQNVVITNIIPNVISGNPLIEHLDTHSVTAQFTIGTTAGSDSLTGSSLWSMVFYIADSSDVEVSGTSATATLVDSGVDVTAGQTFSLQGTATLSLDDKDCSQLPRFCATLSPATGASFTLTADTGYSTTTCTDIACQGVVITNVLPAQTANRPLVQGTNNADLDLTVSLSSDTAYASIQGTGLWQARAFLSQQVDGSGTRLLDHAVDMQNSAGYGLDNDGNSIWPLIQADFDLTSLSCDQFDYICVEVQKGDTPVPEFTLSFNPSTANIGCAQISCTGLVIESGGSITVDMNAGFLEDRTTTVGFNVVYRTSNAGVTGDNLWQLSVYASANSDGSGTQQSPQQVTLTSANSGTDIPTIGADLTLTGLTVSMDFSGLYCADGTIMYLCTVLSKSSSADPDFELSSASGDGSEYTQCVAAPCSGVMISSVMPGSSDSILQNTNPSTITIDIVLAFDSSGGSVSGDGLWNVEVFTSASQTTIAAIDTATVTVGTAANVDAVAGSSSTLPGITAVFDLSSVECDDAPFICVKISKGSSPTVNYELDGGSVVEGCFASSCLGVIVTSITAYLGNTSYITEYQTSSLPADFNLQIITDPNAGSAINNPPGLFKVDVYVSGNSDCSGAKNALQAGALPATPSTLPAGNTQVFSGIMASLDISSLTCSDMEYLCADFTRNDGQTFTITPLVNTAGVMTDCRGVLITSVAFTDSLSVIELSSAAENSITITTLTVVSSNTGADIAGTNLWQVTVFVNADDINFPDTPVGSTFVPLNDEDDLIGGNTLTFNNLVTNIDMTDKTCLDDAMYICVKFERQTSSSPLFKLSGSPNDDSLIGCQQVTCYGVHVTATTLTITDGQEIIERSTMTDITYDLSITADTMRADVSGTNLWSIASSVYTNNDFSTAALVSEETTSSSSSVIDGSGTITGATVSLDVSSLLCSNINYFCTILSKGSTADPNFTLTPDPATAVQACADVTCKGVIVNMTTIAAGDDGSNSWPIVEGKLQDVFLTVTVARDTTSATVSGSNLWIISFFLSTVANGSVILHEFDAVLTTAQSTQALTSDDPVEFTNVEVENWNLGSFLCSQADYICAEIKKNGISNPDFTFEGNTIGCMPLQCRGFEVDSVVVTITSGESIIEWNQGHPLTLSVVVDPVSTSAEAEGDSLWNANVFFSPNSDGTGMRYAETTVDGGGAWRDVDFTSAASQTLSGIMASVNLNASCDNLRYVCFELLQSNSASSVFTFIEADSNGNNIACTATTCTGVIVESSTLTIEDGAPVIEGVSNQNLEVTAVFVHDDSGADITGTNLWEVKVFGSTSSTGAGTRQAESVHRPTPASNTFDDSTDLEFTNVTVKIHLNDIVCSSIDYLCFEVLENTEMVSSTPSIDFTVTGETIACAPLDCNGVIVTQSTLSITDGDPVLERVSSVDVTLALSVTTDNTGAVISGTDLWALTVFTNDAANGQGMTEFDINLPGTTSAGWTDVDFSPAGDTFMLTDISVNLDLTNIICSSIEYICVNLTKAASPSKEFTLDSNPQDTALSDCAEIQCRGVVVDALTLTINTVDDEVVEHSNLEEVDFTLIVSGADNTVEISGSNIWQLRVFMNDMANGTGDSQGIEVFPNIGNAANEALGGTAATSFTMQNIVASFDLQNFVCPATTYFCIELQKDPNSPEFTLDFESSEVVCQMITCRGVELTTVTVSIDEGGTVTEYKSSHEVTLDLTLLSAADGATVVGNDLWEITTYLSADSSGAGPRFASQVSDDGNYQDMNLAAGVTAVLSDVMATLDVSDVACSQFDYICVEVSRNAASVPAFTLDPQPDASASIACTAVNCRGLQISNLNIEISDGSPLIEQTNPHKITADITLHSTPEVELNGTDWDVEMSIGTDDECTGSTITATYVSMTDVMIGENIVLQNVMGDFDLSSSFCSGLMYLCVRVMKASTATPDFQTSSEFITGFTMIPCEGVIIDSVTLAVTDGEPICEANMNFPLDLDVNLMLDANSRTFNDGVVQNIWNLTLFTSRESDGSVISGNPTIVQLNNDQLSYGVSNVSNRQFVIADTPLNTYGLTCDDMAYLCIVASKRSDISPDITISFPPNPSCIRVTCKGVVLDDISVLFDGHTEIRERSPTDITFATFEIDSDPTSSTLSGTNLWQFSVYIATEADGSGTKFGQTNATLTDAQASTGIATAGDRLSFNDVTATLDLTDLKCYDNPLMDYHLCVEFMRNPESEPIFTLQTTSNNPLGPQCSAVGCRGVEITDLSVAVTTGDPVTERSNNTMVFSVTLVSDDDGANINGDNLWMLTAYLTDGSGSEASGNDFTPEENVIITASEAGKDLTAGTDLVLSDLTVTVDLTNFVCPAQVQLCVDIEKGDSASPDFTFSKTSGTFPSCIDIECEGVVITSSTLTETSGITFIEGTANQDVNLDLNFLVADDAGGIDGEDQWKVKVFVNSEPDGSGDAYSEVYGVLPDNFANIPAIPGEQLDFSSVTATLDFSTPEYLPCRDIFHLCATLEEADTATKNFTLTGHPETALTACQRMQCEGVKIEDTVLTVTTANPYVKERSTQEVAFDVTMTPHADSSTLPAGPSLWTIEVFGSSMSDGSGDRAASVEVDPSTIGSVGVTPGTPSGFTGLSVDVNLNGVTCASYSHVCVEVSRNDAADPLFTLQGVPAGDALVACVPIECIGVRVTGGLVTTEPSSITVLEGKEMFMVTLDIQFTTDASGADISGDDLWAIQVFASSSDTGTPAETPKVYGTFEGSSNSQRANAGDTLTFNSFTADIDTSSMTCGNALFICAELSRDTASDPSFTVNGYDAGVLEISEDKRIVCTSVECQGVVIVNSSLSLVDGNYIIERDDRFELEILAEFTSDADAGSLVGSDVFFDLDIFLNDASDGSGNNLGSEYSSEVTVTGMGLMAGSSITVSGSSVRILSNVVCQGMTYVCATLTKTVVRDFTLEGSPTSVLTPCTPITCVGVNIVRSFITVTSPSAVRENEDNQVVMIDFSMMAAEISANVSGTDLWSVTVFTNSDDTGMDATHEFSTDITLTPAQSQEGVAAAENTVLSDLTFSIDLDRISCEGVPYICATISRNTAAGVDFTFTAENNTDTACTPLPCNGVIIDFLSFNQGSISAHPVEHDNNYMFQATPSISVTDDSALLPSGLRLWDYRFFPNTESDGSGSNNGIELVYEGVTSSITTRGTTLLTGKMVTFDISSIECDQIPYICMTLSKGSNPTRPFTLESHPDDSILTTCTEAMCKGVTITAAALTINTGDMISEGDTAHLFDVSAVFSVDPTGATISGSDLWQLTLYATRSSDGSGTRYIQRVLSLASQADNDITNDQLNLLNLQTTVSLENELCSNLMYLCVELEKGNSPKPQDFTLSGELIGCHPLECLGVFITDMTVTTSGSLLENSNNNDITLTATLNSDATDPDSNNNLWLITVFTSDKDFNDPTGSGVRVNEASGAISSAQETQVLTAGTPLVFNPVAATLNIQTTCEEAAFVCMEVRQGTTVQPRVVLIGQTIGCTEITCRNVETTSTSATIVNGGSVVEGENDVDVTLDITVQSNSEGASVSGSNLWKMSMFISSTNGEDGKIDSSETSLVLTSVQANADLTAGSPLVISDLQASLPLNGITCDDALYICIDFRKGDNPSIDFTMSPMPDRTTAQVGCAPVESCQGIEIDSTSFILQAGSPLLSAESNDLTFSVSLEIASDSGTVSGDDLWQLTFFPNSESDGSGAYTSSSTLVIPFADSSQVIRGVTTGLDNVNGALDLTGVLCEDAQYLCLTVAKGDNPETDFTIEDTSDLSYCSAVDCFGVHITTIDLTFGDFTILEDANSLPFDFSLDVTSNGDGASVEGDNLWEVTVFLSPNSDGSGTPISELIATLDNPSEDLAAGDTISLTGSADLDLDGVICGNANHICAILSKSPSASPDFTIEDGEYISCKEFTCEGVVVTETGVSVNGGDPLLQLTEVFVVDVDVTLTTAELSAEITGTDLWEMEVFVSTNADGSGDKVGAAEADLTSSQTDTTVASGTSTSILGVSATLNLREFRCNGVDNYLCVTVSRGSTASPLFSLEGQPEGALTGCVAVDCEGIRITEVGVTVTSGSPMKEGNAAQDIRFDVEIMSNALYAGIIGSDLWAAEAYLSPDGTRGSDYISATIPASEMDKDLVAGVTFSLEGLSGIFDISGMRCSEVMYLCVEIDENAAAAPDFDFSSSQLVSERTGCTEIRCLGIGIEQVLPDFENTGIAEGDDQHTFSFDVEVFPWVGSNTISGSNIWDLNVFVSESNDDSTPRYAEMLATLSQSQRDLMLSPPTALDFQGVTATLDLSGLTCDQYMYACVEVVKTGADAQGITLGGYPDENDIVGCEQITCAPFDSEITITSYTDEIIEFTWTEAIGNFNAYQIRYSPTDGVTNSPAVISSSLARTMDLEVLTPGQEYTIELRLLKNGYVKSTGVVTATQRTKPQAVNLQAVAGTTQEIQLSWDAASGVFDDYVIVYSPDTGVPASPATFSTSDTSALFTNLLPGRVYDFEIYTVSGSEESTRSSVSYATLPPDSTISVSEFTTTTVSLIWSTPDGIDQNFQYRLTYSPNSPTNPITLNSGVNQYTVNNLIQGRLYTFTMSVVAMDSGRELVSEEGVTSQRTYPSAVTTSTETTEETAFTIQWDAAVGDVDQYVLSYKVEGTDNTINTVTISADSTLSYLATGLSIAQEYTVTIVTESGGLQSEPYTKSVHTRPYPIGEVTSVVVTENEITISWVAAPEPVDGYLISYTPTEMGITPASPTYTSSTQLELSNIRPHTTIEYTIQTQTNNARSQPVIYRQRTLSIVPGPVMSFVVVKDKPYQVLVSFNAPSEPNGVITSYIIAYSGTRGDEVLEEKYFQITAQPNHVEFQNIAISSLSPGFTYSFEITASNSKGQGESVVQSGITLDLEAPLITEVINNAVSGIQASHNTISFTLRSDLFSDLNGAVVAFVVMVREVTDNEDLSTEAPEVLPTYRSIEGNSIWGIYQSGRRRNWFGNGARRRKRQVESVQTDNIVIGDEDPCSDTEPCNGPLKSGTAWRYAIRAFNELDDYTDSNWSSPIVTKRDPNIFIYIVIGTVGCFLILIIILLICIFCTCNDKDPYSPQNEKRPLENFSYGGPYNSNTNNSTAVEIHPQSKGRSSKRGRFSRPVPNTRFAHHVKSMGSAGRYKFSDEYEDLRTIGLEQTSVAGDLLENRYKNRYSNILPYDHNRVQISGPEDYINASFISGVTGTMEEYIATQGPLPDTKNDFWRMIWDHNVPTIVMIGQCVEQGRVKCDHYWPFDQDSTVYGNITITMTAENSLPEWIIREFTIEKDGIVRAVRHFNYTAWPAHGVPTDTDAFMRFVRTVHSQTSPNAGPTVVHCSAGVGRTAVFIALDILSQYLVRQKPNDNIDVFGVVAQMRIERCYMVQTEAQYVFIHQAVLDLLQGKISGNNWFLMQKGKNVSNDLDAIQMEANIMA